ncbi:transcription initiation factor TFIID subunit 15 isoform X1 [Ricinus communis]|uniref:transcription initiation factor TFIID subunit 15 isoform X1 n=1 Tax=Ricinus communis TaxID=3988 RepID=UPI00201AC60B|nr:transcription initiation factor TFIID subunit 15 isoform X1 [Ricinus communis]XP_048228930.1 transcription initiation factor TFIID subunit 15 isoform X1 [Ricinus communis]XP_048228931.1 transcription initiation factor TFIID subunit 15 isoform X1 [Ricinus communis]
MMASYSGKGASANGSVYVCNLPQGTDEDMLAEYFGTIGLLKKDKRTGRPKIWLYRDKLTNEPKGDATVTYEDPHAAQAAIEWFNNKDFHGNLIGVFMAESKNKDEHAYNSEVDPNAVGDFGGLEETAGDMNDDGGRGRGKGDASGKAWQQEGDWLCPNTSSCSNVNFAFRGVCNRCGSARPSGASGGSAGAGRGRGRGGQNSGGLGRAATGSTGLFGPNDWPCPMCGNINWAKRTKCNICNTNKPGHNEGGVRGGRGGGYKELDEEEIEETRRRRKEAEEDDGELYDEFGNLKKKFRAKTQQAESGRVLPGAGRAGWEVEELGVIDRDGRERSRERVRERDDRESSKNREHNGRERRRSRSRERDRGKDRDWDYDYDRDRDYGRDRDRDRYRH